MSHFTKIRTNFKNIDALKKSLSDAGFAYTEAPSTILGWQGQRKSVDLAVQVKGSSYGIGFVKNKSTDELEVIADWYGLSSMPQTEFLKRIKQRYAYHCVTADLAAKGFELATETTENSGAIKLTLKRAIS